MLSVKRNITFSERRIKINPIKINWTQITFNTPQEDHLNQKDCLCQQRENCGEIAKGKFLKIAETAHRASSTEAEYSGYSIVIHSISIAGYITAVLAFVCGELPAQEASSFCEKITSCNFIAFFSFLTEGNHSFIKCAYRGTIANLCPNMIHFGALDFRECRTEEVIHFFRRSVY